MNIADNLKAVTKKADAAQKALKKELQAAFNEAAQAFFVQAPDGTTLTWCQYTPYFNDGDPCEFAVNTPDIVVGEKEELIDHNFRWGEHDDSDKLTPEVKEQVEYLAGFIETEEDLMESLYGNGYKVFLSKDGASVTEYEHD